MFRRIPNFVFWILLAFSAAAAGVACIPEDEMLPDAGRDSGLTPPITMTGS